MRKLFFFIVLAFVFTSCQAERLPSTDLVIVDKPFVAEPAASSAAESSAEVQDVVKAVASGGDLRASESVTRIQDEQNTIDIFDSVAPATVFVNQSQVVRDWRTARATEVPTGSGSGFIWDKAGHIVTNFHVIASGHSLSVTLYNQKTYPAKFVGGEPKKDIAVLKIDAPAEELTPIRLPADGYSIAVGQKAVAIGNPFGLDHTLTSGIISAMGRDRRGFGGVTIRDMLQTDASINPGNSGGPLIDSAGQLIGMNTMIFTSSGSSAGIGFAVPFSIIKRIVPQIILTGRAEQVGIGVTILPDDVARRYGIRGVIIQSVGEDTPAERSGLRGIQSTPHGALIGDIIIGIDETEIRNYDELYNALDVKKAGDTVAVKIRRNSQILSVDVAVYTLPE